MPDVYNLMKYLMRMRDEACHISVGATRAITFFLLSTKQKNAEDAKGRRQGRQKPCSLSRHSSQFIKTFHHPFQVRPLAEELLETPKVSLYIDFILDAVDLFL